MSACAGGRERATVDFVCGCAVGPRLEEKSQRTAGGRALALFKLQLIRLFIGKTRALHHLDELSGNVCGCCLVGFLFKTTLLQLCSALKTTC